MTPTLREPYRYCLVIVVAFLATATPASADEGFTFDFPKPAFEYALNPDTGGLAVVVPSQNQVVLYPRFVATKGKGEPLVAKVGKLPTDIAFKQVGDKAYFAVISHADRELTLLDAVTLKPVKTFQLDVAWPMSVVVSTNPKDAAVYYTGYSREKGGFLGRIDMSTMKDEGRLIISGKVGSPAVSADGTRLYVWQGPSGAGGELIEAQEFIRPRPVQPDPKEPTLQDTRALHRAITKGNSGQPPMLPDPFGGFVVNDRRVLTPTLDAEITTLTFAGGLISATRPVIYGINVADGKLAAVSVNTHKLVCSHRLPLKPSAYDYGDRLAIEGPASLGYGTAIRYHNRVLEDAANKMVLVCIGSGVQAIPVAELALPDEPFLVARVEGSKDFSIGRKQDLGVSTVGPDSKVELLSGPVGMTLEAGRLVWTPGETDVGAHIVKLKVSAKDTDRTVPVAITVTRPSIQLPFPPPPGGTDYRLVMSADGKAAIVAGPDPDDKAPGAFRTPSVLAVVNLEKGTVAVQRKLLVGVTTLAADSSYVYAGLADSDSMYVLHRKDLTEAKRIPMPARVAYISPVDDRHVIVTCNSRDRIVLKVPEWEAVALADFENPKSITPRPGSVSKFAQPPVRFAEGWWTDGVLYDDKFEKARAVVAPRGYWRYAAGTLHSLWMPPDPASIPPDGTKFFEKNSPMWFTRWGMAVTTQQKLTNGLRDVGPLEDFRTSVILSELPVAACLNTAWDANAPGGPRQRVEVIYHDLITSKVLLRVPVLDDRRSRAAMPSQETFTGLYGRPGGGLVALADNRLFLMPTPNIEAAKCPAPLHFTPQYPITIITRAGSVPLPKLVGATASVELALRREIKGLTIDRKGWAVTVDPEPLFETLTEGLGTVLGNLKAKPIAGVDGAALDKYLAEVGPRFEKLTGRKAIGVPVWVPVSVIAQDVGPKVPMRDARRPNRPAQGGGLRTAEADIGFFLELPLAPLQAKINTVAAAHPKNPDPNPNPKADPPLTAAQLADILREQGKMQLRIETLEKKIDDLNRKIEALTKALEAKKPQPMRYNLLSFLCAATVIAYIQRSALGVPSKRIEGELGLGPQDMGLVWLAWYAGYAIFQLPAGGLADRFGSKPTLIAFAVLWSLLTAATGTATGFASLCVLWGAMGLAQAGIFVCATKAISVSFERTEQAFAAGALACCMAGGAGMSQYLTGLLIDSLSWQNILAIYALPGLLWAVAFAFIVPSPERTPLVPLVPVVVPVERTAPVRWSRLLTDPQMILLCGQQFQRAAAVALFFTWFPRYLQEKMHVAEADSGRLAAWPLIVGMFGGLLGGTISDWLLRRTGNARLSRQGLAATGTALCAAVSLAAYYAESANELVILVSIAGFCGYASGVSAYATAMTMGGKQVAPVFATMNMAGNIGAGVFPFVVGVLVGRTGNWNFTMLLFAGLFAGSTVCWALLNPKGTLFEEQK